MNNKKPIKSIPNIVKQNSKPIRGNGSTSRGRLLAGSKRAAEQKNTLTSNNAQTSLPQKENCQNFDGNEQKYLTRK